MSNWIELLVREARFTFSWLEWIIESLVDSGQERRPLGEEVGPEVTGPFQARKWVVLLSLVISRVFIFSICPRVLFFKSQYMAVLCTEFLKLLCENDTQIRCYQNESRNYIALVTLYIIELICQVCKFITKHKRLKTPSLVSTAFMFRADEYICKKISKT